MACKIHGLRNCPFPSCAQQQNVMCDAHLMENCHLCPVIAANTPPINAPQIQTAVPNQVVLAASQQVKPAISDPIANEVLSAAEAYAQARQDFAFIQESVKRLRANLRSAQEKLAEALKAKIAAKKALSALTRQGEKEKSEAE